jgi:hypothetical protein
MEDAQRVGGRERGERDGEIGGRGEGGGRERERERERGGQSPEQVVLSSLSSLSVSSAMNLLPLQHQ